MSDMDLNKEQKLIKHLFYTYDTNYSVKQLNEIHTFLSLITEYTISVEYRFACWLKQIFDYDLDVTVPHKPEITNISLNVFENKYVTNDRREMLFNCLKTYVQTADELKNTDYKILIGGSYTDVNKNDPKDIDLVFTIPSRTYFQNDSIYNDMMPYKKYGYINNKVDLRFLPNDYTLNSFKAYCNLTALANDAKHRKNARFSQNFFSKREVVLLNRF